MRIYVCINLICFIFFFIPPKARGDETVPLKIIINTQEKGEHFLIMTTEGDILLSQEQFRECGFREIPEKAKITADGFVSLSSLSPEVSFEIRMQEAALVITAQPNLLEKNIISLGYKRPDTVISTKENSAFLNYAIGYSMGDKFDFRSLSIPSEMGIRVNDYLFYSNFSYIRTDNDESFKRLMTNIIRDDTVNIRRYTIGDFYAFSGILGGGGIMGGLSISKNFSLNPYIVRYQGLHLTGLLNTPSEVDLYINNVSIKKEKLPPGEFEFANLYGQTGAGNAVIVIKDAFGREESIITPFYLSSRLLKPGLHDYSYNIGFKRADFGEKSFSYKEATFIGYHRYGFHETFTGGLAGEVDGDVLNLAGMATFVPGRAGEIDTVIAASQRDGKSGYGAFLSYSYAGKMLSGNASCRYFSRDYTNLSLKEADSKPRFEARTGIGLHSQSLGSLSATVQFLSRYGADDVKKMSVYYNRSLGNNINLSITATRTDELKTTYDVFAGLVFVLGKDHFGTLNMQSQDSRKTVTTSIEKYQPRGPGISYKLTAEARENDSWQAGGQAYVQYKGPYGIYSAGFRTTSGSSTYDLNLSGGVAFMKRSFYASRPITDSFGLITVGDVEGVKVLYSNEEVAVTNSKGEAIVPGLLSYNDNKLSIEPSDIPVNYEIAKLDTYVSPPYRGGSMITFFVKKLQAFEGRLYLVRKGAKKPAESAVLYVMIDDDVIEAVIGKRGEFYIENLRPGIWPVRLTLYDEQCSFEMNVPESNEMSVNLGEITCEMD